LNELLERKGTNMIAQLDVSAADLRLFDGQPFMVCELRPNRLPDLRINADKELRRLKMCRCGPWIQRGYGYETRVRFAR
jgi:hypothetical protein